MKYLSKVIITSLFLGSCDPRSSKDLYQQGFFTFSVKVLNPRDTINLGDSVCFIFEIPDTVTINGNKVRPFYGSNDGVTISLEDSKMDTTLGGESRGFTPDCDTYATPGNTQGGLNLGKISNNKLYSKFYMIPKKKGVYFLSNPQAGYFSINNEGIKGRLLYTLDVIDKHHSLLINTARPQNRTSFAAFIQAQEGMGQPIYGFAVK
ncbi:MAG: hypothetical protein ACRENO_05300 [Thermodesulfobacteriota bacterium]